MKILQVNLLGCQAPAVSCVILVQGSCCPTEMTKMAVQFLLMMHMSAAAAAAFVQENIWIAIVEA